MRYTKIKFQENVAAKEDVQECKGEVWTVPLKARMKRTYHDVRTLTHANVSRTSIFEGWVSRTSFGKLAGPGKAGAEVCGELKFSQCPCWRQTQEQILEPVV